MCFRSSFYPAFVKPSYFPSLSSQTEMRHQSAVCRLGISLRHRNCHLPLVEFIPCEHMAPRHSSLRPRAEGNMMNAELQNTTPLCSRLQNAPSGSFIRALALSVAPGGHINSTRLGLSARMTTSLLCFYVSAPGYLCTF